jgi:hypothetical protein
MPSPHTPIALVSTCSKVDICKNNRCIYRLRDVFHHPIWTKYPDQQEAAMKALKNAGVKSEDILCHPSLSIDQRMNYFTVNCKDFIV